MSELIYTAMTSLDGYLEDSQGAFDWAMPDAEVHGFLNNLAANVGTEIYGRRMYETMAIWQTVGDDAEISGAEPVFDSETLRRMKDAASQDIGIGGPGLAQHGFRAGLVDDVHLFVFPVVVGGGKPGLPREVRLDLELVEDRRSASGVIHLHYRTR